jgi:outer membrane protein assembly factor BamB
MSNGTLRAFLHLVLLALAMSAGFAKLAAADWPGFRGAHGDGIAAGEKVPICFGPSSNLLWKAQVPEGLSSPVVSMDQVFLTGANSNRLITLALDSRTGKSRWERNIEVEKLEPVHKVNSHASSTAVSDGKALYAYFGSFGVVAYTPDGKELWRKSLPVPKTFANQGTGTSPVLADNKLLVFVQLGSDSRLLALNPADGTEVWKAPMPQHNMSYSTPVTWAEDNRGFVGMTCAGQFTVFSLADGKEAWSIDDIGYQACSTPVAAGDRLLVTVAGVQGDESNVTPPPGFDEMLQKYDKNGDGVLTLDEIPPDLLYTDRQATDGKGNMPMRQALGMMGGVKKDDKLDRQKWEEARKNLTGFRTSPWNRTVVIAARIGGKEVSKDSRVLWKETKGVPEVPSALVWRDRVYLIRSGGILACRALQTGKLIYDERIDAVGGYFASPVLADERIYVASDRGVITVVKAGDTPEVLCHNNVGEPVLASPAIAANTLYIRSTKQLWAFAQL